MESHSTIVKRQKKLFLSFYKKSSTKSCYFRVESFDSLVQNKPMNLRNAVSFCRGPLHAKGETFRVGVSVFMKFLIHETIRHRMTNELKSWGGTKIKTVRTRKSFGELVG